MTNMSIQPLWLTHFIEILWVLEFQLTKFIVGTFFYKAHFRPQISSNETSDAESKPEVQNHLPTWARQTLSPAGDNIGNPDDPRRTRSDFQREGIALSCPDYFLYEYFYLMIISDPKSYYHAWKDPRWKISMDEEMNSLQKNTTWELVSLPPGRKLVQCKWVFQTKVAVYGRT